MLTLIVPIKSASILTVGTYFQLQMTPLLRFGIWDKDTSYTLYMDTKVPLMLWTFLLVVTTFAQLVRILSSWFGNPIWARSKLKWLMSTDPKEQLNLLKHNSSSNKYLRFHKLKPPSASNRTLEGKHQLGGQLLNWLNRLYNKKCHLELDTGVN